MNRNERTLLLDNFTISTWLLIDGCFADFIAAAANQAFMCPSSGSPIAVFKARKKTC